MTHQLRVLSGSTTWLSTALHQKIISKFDVCWVPDHEKEPSLSGELGHAEVLDTPIKYLGPLSRLNKTKDIKQYKLLVLLSGPEPQRSFLEEQLLHSLESYPHPCLFVRGVIEDEIRYQEKGKLKIYNYLTSEQLERSINSSELILCRSGYTTIMDLAKLEKKAFFIPTPGQFEQEYLAERFMENGIAPCSSQEDFQLDWLSEVDNYTGFKNLDSNVNFEDLFDLF
jgi:hypothetical protein